MRRLSSSDHRESASREPEGRQAAQLRRREYELFRRVLGRMLRRAKRN